MEILTSDDLKLQGEIERLRTQYPDTQDLYREVCVLLFFRHGVTPTANKLYQLVRKGSMSAPAEALNRFWETLREKSRVRIEHPDLPEGVKNSAAEMVAALWREAHQAAQQGLAELAKDAQAQVLVAQQEAKTAADNLEDFQIALTTAQLQLQDCQEQLQQVQADLSKSQGEAGALQRQVDSVAQREREQSAAHKESQRQFEEQLQHQREMLTQARQQFEADHKRLLIELDRERSTAIKVQKELEQVRKETARTVEQHQQQEIELRQQLELAHRSQGELKGTLVELRRQLEVQRTDVERLSALKGLVNAQVAQIDALERRAVTAEAKFEDILKQRSLGKKRSEKPESGKLL